MTNKEFERITILIESCSELQHILCKTLRFGFDSYHPNDPTKSNRQLIYEQICSLMLDMNLLFNEDLEETSKEVEEELIQNLIVNKNKYLQYNYVEEP